MQKSIEVLSNLQGHIEHGINGGVIMSVELAQALKDATEAMKKQIPMELVKYTDTRQYVGFDMQVDVWLCPGCNEWVTDVGEFVPDYCESCGQRLEVPHGSEENN